MSLGEDIIPKDLAEEVKCSLHLILRHHLHQMTTTNMLKLTTVITLLGSLGLAYLPATQLVAQAQQTQPPELLGLVGLIYESDSIPGKVPVYRNLPRGMTIRSGLLPNNPQQPLFTVSVAEMSGRDLLLFERYLKNQNILRSNGYANFQTMKILDVMVIPKGMSTISDCQANGKKLPRVFGLITNKTPMNQQWITQLAQVWQINVQTQKFERINIPGLRCENVGWGA